MGFVDLTVLLGSALSIAYLLTAFLDNPPALEARNKPADPAGLAAAAIREIEFDYAAGKLSKEDFERVKQQTIAELAGQLKEGRKST